ncbi:motility associated factor glycosyltransferase family protein [Sulfurimonas sp. SAG-AH-194-C20]|nr:6-hydroxymethylpterin diphosphokinase MptE-like protein [Sulfurimonas sp. SAG-AH-194-C20]MDF1878200.1 motility associated factor glycosyltransferase family protein [Sulfurimonas sp. SAG-AH-194-C20]
MNKLIQNNFTNNVKYLHQNHLNLYNRLLSYEKKIADGELLERYELTYEENGFDVYVKEDDNYLYAKNSTHFTNIMTQSVNDKKDESTFKTYKILPLDVAPQGYKFLFDFYTQHHQDSYHLKELQKFIFFGVGLGLHLSSISKKINAKMYLIVEDDMELFRLSLFTTRYYEIAQNSQLYFCIASKSPEFKITATKFLEDKHYYNQYIKFFEFIHHSEEKLNLFHTLTTTQSHLNFFYTSISEQYTKPLEYLKENYNFLNLTSQTLHEQFKKKPTLLLAPGPSLGKNIAWVKEHQDKFIIVALSATLLTLYEAGIRPDIITHFDGFERSIVHLQKIPDKTYFDESILLTSAKTPKKVVAFFDKARVFFFESGTNFKEGFGEMSAFCAGSSTYLLLIAFEVQELYLLGLDLAVDAQTLQTHTDNYTYKQELSQESSDTLDFRNSLIQTQGNFTQTVQTTPNFSISINAINEISQGLKKETQNVYNLSEGALLKGTKPFKTEDIILIQKPSTGTGLELLNIFTNNSQNYLSKQELAFLLKMKQYNKKLLVVLEQYEQNNVHKEILNILIKLEKELTSATSKEAQIITLILQNYIRFSYTFIFDFFNTQEIMIETYQEQLFKKIIVNIKDIITTFNTKI